MTKNVSYNQRYYQPSQIAQSGRHSKSSSKVAQKHQSQILFGFGDRRGYVTLGTRVYLI